MSLYDIVDALQAMGKAMRAVGEEAVAAAAKTRDYNAAAEEGASSEAGIKNAPDNTGSVSMGATSLGDPRDAADSAMRMNAAIEAAKRR